MRIYSVEEAQKSILKRRPLDEWPVGERVLDSIARVFGERLTPEQAVQRILREVRQGGDRALREWSQRLDDFAPHSFRVPPQELQEALRTLDPQVRQALEQAAARIEAFYRRQPLISWMSQDLGGVLGQLVRPIRRVGLYVPGGTAPLPSTVLMTAIPARVAGVQEIAITVPPQRGSGQVSKVTLAAAALAGVEEVYVLGGAQAIAALAFGTESIPAVDKIFGPGNLFVTLAKRQVFGVVGIDGLAGPTETMVIADEAARPDWVAADLLAQAEHDVLASAILLTPSGSLAQAVQAEVARQIESLPRGEIVAQALEHQSGIVLTRDLHQAVELANAYGAEHLCLAVRQPWEWVDKITRGRGIVPGRVFVRGAWGLHRRSEPCHADRRDGALCFSAEPDGLCAPDQPGGAGRANRPVAGAACGATGPRRRAGGSCTGSGSEGYSIIHEVDGGWQPGRFVCVAWAQIFLLPFASS
jgi:histidinol dehydrogenase